MSELKVVRFHRDQYHSAGGSPVMAYTCSEPYAEEGDYVPLADVRALEARARKVVHALDMTPHATTMLIVDLVKAIEELAKALAPGSEVGE